MVLELVDPLQVELDVGLALPTERRLCLSFEKNLDSTRALQIADWWGGYETRDRPEFRALRFSAEPQKGLAMLAVAKRFGASGARGGEAGADNSVFQAVLQARSPNKLVQETSIEAVACPNGIDGLNSKTRNPKAIPATLGNYALRTALDDHDRNCA